MRVAAKSVCSSPPDSPVHHAHGPPVQRCGHCAHRDARQGEVALHTGQGQQWIAILTCSLVLRLQALNLPHQVLGIVAISALGINVSPPTTLATRDVIYSSFWGGVFAAVYGHPEA